MTVGPERNRGEKSVDLAVALLGALRECGRVAFAKTSGAGGPGKPEVPRSLDRVRPEALTELLRESGLDVRVASLRVLSRTAGTTDRARFALTYEPVACGGSARTEVDCAKTGGEAPSSVFVKLAPSSTGAKIFGNLMSLGATEVRFYREIAPDVPVRIPRVYGCGLDPRDGAFVLVLEDLEAAGARFIDVSSVITVAQTRSVVDALARLHASFWDNPRLRTDLAWIKGPGSNCGLRLERALCRAAVGPGVRRFAGAVPARVRELAPRIVAARARMDAFAAVRPMTLIHGDSHVGNMFFAGDEVGLLDWQVIRRERGLRDLAYFLVSSVPTDIRRKHERELVAAYLARLDACGVAALSFDDAWFEYRLNAVHGWVAAVVTAAARGLQPEPIARAGVERASRALLDLETAQALDAIGA